MELPHREYITGDRLQKFLDGAAEILGDKTEEIALVRLCIKRSLIGADKLISIWGHPDRPFGLFIETVIIASGVDWANSGRVIGEDLLAQIEDKETIDAIERKQQARKFDVWQTNEYTDRAEDVVDTIERQFGPHINGRFHWLVRKGLIDLIHLMVMDTQTAVVDSLSLPEHRAVLESIVRRAGFILEKPQVKKPKKETA